MKQLVSVITSQILRQIRPNEVNMVRLESFDDPIIYKSVCENLRNNAHITNFVAKITMEKYSQLSEIGNANWNQALQYLHMGENTSYMAVPSPGYERASFIDFERAITKWRNESPNMPAGQTSLVLLMGTEAAPDDAGSLKDTTFVISPREIVSILSTNYSTWFNGILEESSFDNEESKMAIHTLYRAIFANININIFRLSEFIDSLSDIPLSSCQDLIDYICETLNSTWQIPSIIESKSVPKVNSLSKGKLAAAKIVTNAIQFIGRADDIPSASMLKKIRLKFDKYAQNKDIDTNDEFPADSRIYKSYGEFEKSVIDFMCGINLDTNRPMLLNVDYAIIDQIIGTKLAVGVVEKAKVITGEPMEAYSRIFLSIADQFGSAYGDYPTQYCVRVDRVALSDCVDDQKDEAFRNICNFLGGILSFYNSCNLACDGTLVDFSYDGDKDPFDFDNHDLILNNVRSTGKWGEPCKISFTVKACNADNSHNYEFVWAFSPYAPWLNAFSYLGNVIFRSNDNSYTIPTMVVCKNIAEYLRCESEDEFYAQIGQIDDEVLWHDYAKIIRKYFAENVTGIFDKLCEDFKNFALRLTEHGFFGALNNLRAVVDTYTQLMQFIQDNHGEFTDVQQEKLPLLLNAFLIVSNEDVLEKCDMGEVLFPAYNPVMLEKIDAQQIFLRDGFSELATSKMSKNIRLDKLLSKLESLVQLSTITQGVDFIAKKTAVNLMCKSMWEYYGVYYDSNEAEDLISGNAFGSVIVTDDEDAAAMLHATPTSGIVVRNVLDYIRTFPARVDGLNLAFIAPPDMQHIVAAIHAIAKRLEADETPATINLRIICLNSKKNSATYLKKWLDSYFDDERSVTVNTFLQNATIDHKSDADILAGMLHNCDLCFNYDILQSIAIQFDLSGDEIIDKEQAKFPMTFTPDTIPATHGKSRKVSISQFQFLAAKAHTQANYTVENPYAREGVYRTFRTLELTDIENHIIELSHQACKWVVCVDPAIDRKMLENEDSRIIGFTTGEGSYGELNVTVSARQDILKDIKQMLQGRIKEKFSNWDNSRLQKASAYCVDVLSQYMDGSRILKALNPYDYEIHSFLAYLLTMQMLDLSTIHDEYAVRSLISLDSYKHWFAEDDDLSADSKRPDFMLLEIPKSEENLDPSKALQIEIKIIECKMGFQNDNHIVKAQSQLEKGLHTMCINWNPENASIMHRYWLNQLYRAIIFAPLNLDNTTSDYRVIRDNIYGILSGKYEIQWSGDIFAFWLDSPLENEVTTPIHSSLPEEMEDIGISLGDMICHECGQMFIQKMLLPPEERNEVFVQNEIVKPEDFVDPEDEDENSDSVPDTVPATASGTTSANSAGESIPRATSVYLPFLRSLSDEQEHTRQGDLGWFENVFSITQGDRKLPYDNGHLKWETVLDRIITLFRQNAILENSSIASYHITDFGKGFGDVVEDLLQSHSFEKAIRVYRESLGKIDPTPVIEPETRPAAVSEPEIQPAAVSEPEIQPAAVSEPEIQPAAVSKPENQLGAILKPKLNDVRFLIGQDLRTKEEYYWEFGNKSLNNRHLLINGNSGCGKTYCIQTLLLEMTRAGVSGVVFDYTSGFTPDKLDPIFMSELGDKIKQRVVYIDKIPVNPFTRQTVKVGGIEVPEADTFVATRLANVFTTVYGFGGQQKSALYKAIKNGLQHYKDNMSFSYLEKELNDVNAKQAETVLSKIQPFLDLEPFADDEEFSWGTIRDSEGIVYVMQLDGFDRPTQLLLTELLLWDIWNYCVKNGNEDHPFVVVLDEAQNLSHDAESPSAKFLTEGRKFGISAWYATQFMKPQLSDDEIQRLQQAGQKLYFCPPDDGVMTVAKNIDIDSLGAKEWAPKLKALKKGECVTCGNMVRNEKWVKYEPRIVKVTSFQERTKE